MIGLGVLALLVGVLAGLVMSFIGAPP